MAIHLLNHEGLPNADAEFRVDHLQEHLHWSGKFAGDVMSRAQQRGLIERENGQLVLTENGRQLAQKAIVVG